MNVLTSTLVGMNELATTPSFAADDRQFVYAVARRIVRSPDDAEDCAQNALLLAYRHRDSFRGDSHYRTWLYRIATTTALGYLRQQRRGRLRFVANDGSVVDERPDPAPSAVATLEQAEDRAQVQAAIAELPPLYREVLVERADATEQEVATKLGITVGNVKIRSHRARKMLKDALVRLETHEAAV